MRVLHARTALLVALSYMAAVEGCRDPRTEVPPARTARDGSADPVIKPAELVVTPVPFSRNTPITVSAHFKAPPTFADFTGFGTCSDNNGNPVNCDYSCSLVVRVYPVDDNDGEPSYDEQQMPSLKRHIAASSVTFWPQPEVGSDVERQFGPFPALPNGGDQLYFVLWRVCSIPNTQPGEDPIERGKPLGSAKFKEECSGGKTTMRCVYRRA